MKKLIAFLGFFLLFSLFAEDRRINVGEKVILLHDDFTWEYVEEVDEGFEKIILRKDSLLKPNFFDQKKRYQISLDPEEWHSFPVQNPEAAFQFVNEDETGFCVVIYDALEVPLDQLKSIMILNATNIDPEARIIREEACEVNGVQGELVEYIATQANIPFTFLSFINSSESGSLQYTFYTLSSYFERVKPAFLEAIAGMEML